MVDKNHSKAVDFGIAVVIAVLFLLLSLLLLLLLLRKHFVVEQRYSRMYSRSFCIAILLLLKSLNDRCTISFVMADGLFSLDLFGVLFPGRGGSDPPHHVAGVWVLDWLGDWDPESGEVKNCDTSVRCSRVLRFCVVGVDNKRYGAGSVVVTVGSIVVVVATIGSVVVAVVGSVGVVVSSNFFSFLTSFFSLLELRC